MRDRIREHMEKRRNGDVEGYWLYDTIQPTGVALEEGKSWFRLPKPGQLWSLNSIYEFAEKPHVYGKIGEWVMIVSSQVHYSDSSYQKRWVVVQVLTEVLYRERVWPVNHYLQLWHNCFTPQDGRKPHKRIKSGELR